MDSDKGPKINSNTYLYYWLLSGEWADVESSNVDSIAYDSDREILKVRFKKSGTYHYKGVRDRVAAEMFFTTSMGKFVHKRLKNVYGFIKI